MFSLFKTKATLDEVASGFVSYCMKGHIPGHSVANSDYVQFGLENVVDENLFEEERKYLRIFAVDYGTTMVFGVNKPKTNAILDTVSTLLLDSVNEGKLPHNFSETLEERLDEYSSAVTIPGDMGPSYWVGKVFACQLCSGLNLELIVKGSILFASDIKFVTSVLKSTRIIF